MFNEYYSRSVMFTVNTTHGHDVLHMVNMFSDYYSRWVSVDWRFSNDVIAAKESNKDITNSVDENDLPWQFIKGKNADISYLVACSDLPWSVRHIMTSQK